MWSSKLSSSIDLGQVDFEKAFVAALNSETDFSKLSQSICGDKNLQVGNLKGTTTHFRTEIDVFKGTTID